MAIVDVRDMSVLESDSFSTTVTFTLFLDQIATAPVTLRYFYQGGTASEAAGDFNEFASSVTIPAGSDRTTISTSIFRDDLIEGNEFFDLFVIAGLNAELPDGAAALRARATIYDLSLIHI